jgi:hypothetical protein
MSDKDLDLSSPDPRGPTGTRNCQEIIVHIVPENYFKNHA